MSKKSIWGKAFLSGASLAAMGAMNPALAQEGEVSDEIVVTATGRTAAIQDVPIAVTAISSETLEEAGVQSLIDLRQITPNLRIGSGQSQTAGTSAAIRGIGTGSDNPGFEAAVGIFIDGVYRARAGTAINDLGDVERIEVLRGPQGTLYGKNTTAGAISVVTASPDFEPGMWMEGTGGERDLLGARVGANLPVSDSLAFRFDGSMRGADGYIDVVNIPGETLNNTNRWNARGQMLWDISSDASLRVIVDGGEIDEQCCGAVTFADTSNVLAAAGSFPFSFAMNLTQPGSVLTPSVGFPGTTGPAVPEERRTSVTPSRIYSEQAEDFGVSGQLDWGIGDVNLTSITGYRDWDSVRDQDIDFSAMDRSYRDDLEIGVQSFTQEIRLQGEWGRVDWLVGAFYGDETVEQTDTIRYGNQGGAYLNSLIGFFDFSGLGATDQNGPLPGSGLRIFGANCGVALGPANNCALDWAFAGLAGGSLDPAREAAAPGTQAALVSALGPTGFGADLSSAVIANTGQQGDNWAVDTQSIALFTHNEIELSDSLVLTVGLRYTQEEKEMTADLNGTQPACDAIRANADAAIAAALVYRANPVLPAGTQAALNGLAANLPAALLLACNPAVNNLQVLQNGGNYGSSVEDDAISGTVSLAWHANDDLMIYGGYSRGYKSGGFNIDRSGMSVLPFSELAADRSAYATAILTGAGIPLSFGAQDLDFEPETIDAYELGFKATMFGGSSTLNMAAYYQQLHDYQLNAFNGFNFITRNVPEVISQGVEMEFATRPTDELTLTFGALYSDVYYDSTVAFRANSPSDTVTAGDPLTLSPEWTVTGSVMYELPIGDSHKATFYGNGRYLSDYRLQTLSRNPLTDQEAFAIFDARIGFGSQNDSWGIDVWVRNLTDEYYSIGAFAVPEQSLFTSSTGQVEGVFAAYPNEPRTVGVTLRARY
ncbi:MAG: TonB-dependent receptor [Hyphomonadaceae bacterium]|nr:TonB-dependent receptor [Hyphomonadaceae bacterium]